MCLSFVFLAEKIGLLRWVNRGYNELVIKKTWDKGNCLMVIQASNFYLGKRGLITCPRKKY